MASQTAFASFDILEPAPRQPLGYYDYFGKLLNPHKAAELVEKHRLDPRDPTSYQKVGAVQISQDLIAKGENIFFNRKIGDTFGLQRVFGSEQGLARILPEINTAIANLQGQPTTNLQIALLNDITLGSRTFPQGTVINTGLKVEKGGKFPLGFTPQLDITCALCHASLSDKGERLAGIPNSELAIPLLIALAPNTSAGFARLTFNPLDPQYKGNGKTILDSQGNPVELPDPNKFEQAFDDAVLDVPIGQFESSPALNTGSVRRGARVFAEANCATCHIAPFFTDNKIHPIAEIGTNSARARSRLKLNDLLVPPQLYAFNTAVPIPDNAQVLDVPTEGISDSPTTLPKGILPNGGYKTTSLRGLYLSAPYLHDGGVAVRAGSLKVDANGSFNVVDPSGLGLTGTLSQSLPADAASSLRALVDRQLRALVVKANQAYPALVRSNLDGTGHDFYVDQQAGFNANQQTDLINFLLALDDDPNSF